MFTERHLFQEDVIEKLRIIPFKGFRLDHPCNLAYRKSEGYARGPI